MNALSLTKLSATLILALSAGTLSLLLSSSAQAENKIVTKDPVKEAIVEGKIAEPKVSGVSKPPADPDFKKLDGNGDNKISLKEAVKDKSLSTMFDVTDSNHDGSITADEYASYKAAMSTAPMDSAVTPVN